MNALAAEIALVLDELSAELILSQRIQGVLKFEADAVSTVLSGATLPASLVNATCLPVPPRNDAFSKLGAGKLRGTRADTLLGVVCSCLVRLWKGNAFCSVREDRLTRPK